MSEKHKITMNMADAEYVVCGTVNSLRDFEAKHRKWPMPYERGIYCNDCGTECICSAKTKQEATEHKKPYVCIDCLMIRTKGGTA